MTKFETYLIDIGFIAYRSTNNGFERCKKLGFYSTQDVNGVSYHSTYYKRGDDFIMFGLNEVGVPPTVREIVNTDHKRAHHFVTSNDPAVVLAKCLERNFKYDKEYLSRFT